MIKAKSFHFQIIGMLLFSIQICMLEYRAKIMSYFRELCIRVHLFFFQNVWFLNPDTRWIHPIRHLICCLWIEKQKRSECRKIAKPLQYINKHIWIYPVFFLWMIFQWMKENKCSALTMNPSGMMSFETVPLLCYF